MKYFYNVIVIPLLYLGFHFIGLFNDKVRRGIRGRRGVLKKLKNDLGTFQSPRLWFHISSYGEYQQAKPVLMKLKSDLPDLFIVVTFFSPSAYEHIQSEQPVDYICYLPFDTLHHVRRFLALVDPVLAVVVRHDIWPNYIWTLNQKKIPVILIDASLPVHSSRFWPIIRSFSRRLFSSFDEIYTISQEEKDRLSVLVSDPDRLIVTGDTKFDQVHQRSLNMQKIDHLQHHPSLKDRRIWVVGSSWPADEEKIIPCFASLAKKFTDLLLIIAPHEPSEGRISDIESLLGIHGLAAVRYSHFQSVSMGFRALIIDRIGLLANLYSLGTIAFVGGSFESKVHNVLEPAIYGIPVMFGPKIWTQAEAELLVKRDAAWIVHSTEELTERVTHLLENPELANQLGQRARQVVLEHTGATEKIASLLKKWIEQKVR